MAQRLEDRGPRIDVDVFPVLQAIESPAWIAQGTLKDAPALHFIFEVVEVWNAHQIRSRNLHHQHGRTPRGPRLM